MSSKIEALQRYLEERRRCKNADGTPSEPSDEVGPAFLCGWDALAMQSQALNEPSDATKRMAKIMGCEFVPKASNGEAVERFMAAIQSEASEVDRLEGFVFSYGQVERGIRNALTAMPAVDGAAALAERLEAIAYADLENAGSVAILAAANELRSRLKAPATPKDGL